MSTSLIYRSSVGYELLMLALYGRCDLSLADQRATEDQEIFSHLLAF